MCVNTQSLVNRYSGKLVTVSCRHCSDCLVQSYRAVASKIHNEMCESGFNYFFVTLTYSNEYVPFLDYTDLSDDGILLIYRHKLCHDRVTLPSYIKNSKNWLSNYSECHCIDYFDISACDNFNIDSLLDIPCPIGDFSFSNIAIVYNKDIRNFFKRLRKYLFIHNVFDSFKYFQVSEYGETTFRPHFHIIFKTKISESVLKDAICESWKMCDFSKVERWFERAISPANYLSLYSVSKVSLPACFQSDVLKPSRSHSLHFGFANHELQPDRFFELTLQGITTYRILHKTSTEIRYVDVPFPHYVNNRYFPKFKGYSRLSLDEKFCFYEWFSKLPRYYREDDFIRNLSVPISLERTILYNTYTYHDLYLIYLCFRRVQVFADSIDISMYDYIICWHSYYIRRLGEMICSIYKDVNFKFLIDGFQCSPDAKKKFLFQLDLTQSKVLSDFSKTNKIKRSYLAKLNKLNYV